MRTNRTIPTSLALTAALFCAPLLPACGGGGGGGGPQLASLGGTVVGGDNQGVPGVEVRVYDQNGDELPALASTTDGAGRWKVTSIPVLNPGISPAVSGGYSFKFVPPESGAGGSAIDLPRMTIQGISPPAGDSLFQPLFLPPLVGGVFVTDNSDSAQNDLTFHTDPLDGASPEPLPGLSLSVPAKTQIKIDGADLTPADDEDPGTPGIQVLFRVGFVAPERLPQPFLDEDGMPRINQLFFTLDPAGATFHEGDAASADFGDPKLIQPTYPSLNGLIEGTTVDFYYFDQDANDWALAKLEADPASAATGTVSLDAGLGLLVIEPGAGAGLPSGGLHGSPGPIPPITNVFGQITANGSPVGANVMVVTENGLWDLTDSNGDYQIDDVPVNGVDATLMCLVMTDPAHAFEVVASDPVIATFPSTQIDVEIQNDPPDLDPPEVDTNLTTPADGATGVGIDMPVSIVFDEDMNSLTLIGLNIGLTGPGPVKVPGEVLVTGSAKAVFVPDDNLDADTLYTLDVGTGVQDLNGNGLAAAFTSSFTTGGTTSTQVEVFAIHPTSGVAGQTVTIEGVNLDEVDEVLFAGQSVTPATQSETAITFEIPELDISAGSVDLDLALVTDAAVGVPSSFDLMPSITSLSPTFGTALGDDDPEKTLVTISGFNFAADGLNAEISFAGTLATIESAKGESASSTQIAVNAPAGATSGSLIVRVAAGYATSPGFFTVVPAAPPPPPSFASSTPLDGATDVANNTAIVVRVDAFVQGSSELRVTNEGAGGSPIAGATAVTADGDEGVLTFTPAANLPIQTVIGVSAGTGAGTIRDLYGQPIDASSWPDGAGGLAFETGGQFEPLPQDGIDTFLDGNIQESLAVFNAIKTWPGKTQAEIDEAELYSILIELTLLVDTEGTGTAADNLHALLAGFGFPAGGPDIFNPDAFVAPLALPGNSPTCDQVLNYLNDDLLPALHALLMRVQALPPSFSAPPRSFWVDSAQMIAEIIEVDATDVKVLEGGMEFALFGLHFLAAYGCDLDIDSLANLTVELDINQHLLNADPTLLVLEDAGDLVMSRNALRNSLTAYDAAHARLLAEVDDQCDDLIIFACNDPVEEQYVKDQVQALALILDKVYATTSGIHDWVVDDQTGAFVRVDGNVPYTTLDIRSLLPTFVSNSEWGIIGPLPDPDINGLLPLWAADDAAENLGLPVPQDDLATAQTPITCDGNLSDWAAAGVTTPLGTDNVAASDLSLWFDDGYYGSYGNAAVDIHQYYAAEDADTIYFRMHFAAGTPDPNLNIYSLGLESNDPANLWYIDIEIWDFDDDNDFDVVMYGPDFGPVSGTVGVGSGVIEFCVPKAPMKSSVVIDDGDEFVLFFESLVFPPPNWPWWDVGGDETASYRLYFNL